MHVRSRLSSSPTAAPAGPAVAIGCGQLPRARWSLHRWSRRSTQAASARWQSDPDADW